MGVVWCHDVTTQSPHSLTSSCNPSIPGRHPRRKTIKMPHHGQLKLGRLASLRKLWRDYAGEKGYVSMEVHIYNAEGDPIQVPEHLQSEDKWSSIEEQKKSIQHIPKAAKLQMSYTYLVDGKEVHPMTFQIPAAVEDVIEVKDLMKL